jgi:hypothetical protein
MVYGRSAELWLLVVYVSIGFGSAFWMLSQQRIRASYSQVTRAAIEIGAVAGLIWWVVIALLGFSFGGGILAAGVNVVVRVVAWGVPAGLLASWRMDRTLKLPFYQSSEIITPLCGVMVLLFLLVSAAHYLSTAL